MEHWGRKRIKQEPVSSDSATNHLAAGRLPTSDVCTSNSQAPSSGSSNSRVTSSASSSSISSSQPAANQAQAAENVPPNNELEIELLSERVLEVIRRQEGNRAIRQSELINHLPASLRSRMSTLTSALNKLIADQAIDVGVHEADGEIMYRAQGTAVGAAAAASSSSASSAAPAAAAGVASSSKAAEGASLSAGSTINETAKSDDDKMILTIIENAGNRGIWTKEIRSKSNMGTQPLKKTLERLEKRKLIKSVNAINAGKKKLYMLYDVQPDISITGGTWYSTNQEFEIEFVEILYNQCLQFLEKKKNSAAINSVNPLEVRRRSYATLSETCKYINDLGISNVKLTESDIENLMDTLVFDGKVLTSGSPEGMRLYRYCNDNLAKIANGLMRTPCGGCPLMRDCQLGGEVSPTSCQYLKQWIDSF